MKYGSVCSGIEAATVAWHPLGWSPAFFSEIEKFPREVLAHHYPAVPLHGDFTTIKKGDYEPIELLVGGTPCQSFSVAGLRKGLDDPRGNLMLEFGALARRLSPRWLVWENVPGVLSSNGGKDFGSFITMLAELGYGFAYRVLDAQYFGVAQRRRRVFVVGCFGDWRNAAAVLFERDSLQGNPAPSRKERQEVTEIAGTLAANGGGLTRPAGQGNELDFCVTTFDRQSSGEYGNQPVASTMSARDYKSPSDLITYAPQVVHGTQDPCVSDIAFAQGRNNGGENVLIQQVAIPINTMTMMGRPSDDLNPRMGLGIGEDGEPQKTLTKAHSHAVAHGYGYSMAVRRLTPTECERLQGFHDGYTKINEKTADGPRYKALGNSMAVPVMRWIGERIQMVEDIKK